jgi:hypothetical protein
MRTCRFPTCLVLDDAVPSWLCSPPPDVVSASLIGQLVVVLCTICSRSAIQMMAGGGIDLLLTPPLLCGASHPTVLRAHPVRRIYVLVSALVVEELVQQFDVD